MIKSLFTSAPSDSPRECAARLRSGAAVLIDVREPGEWASGVAAQAALLPLGDLTGSRTLWQPFLAAHAGKELLVYCAAGGRSGIAARILTSEGFRATNTGGFSAWVESGWPVAQPDGKQPG
jgi:rhodanese-related sulfurtransferase